MKNCRFIWFENNDGQELPVHLTNVTINNFDICSLSAYNKILVLDHQSYQDMLMYGRTNYTIDTCVCLDTQAVSYLKGVFQKDGVLLTERTRGFIDYFLKNDINYDYVFYMLENSLKLGQDIDKVKVYENILACERFKCIDNNVYRIEGEFKYTKSEQEIFYNADQSFFVMNNMAKADEINTLWDRFYAIEAIFLKMVSIEFTCRNKSVKFKMQEMINFINNELGCIFEREIAICYLFWKRDDGVEKFFKKIQNNNKNLIKDIRGMAWDLFHIRQLEYNMENIEVKGSRYELNSILTFDNGLKEVLLTYPIRSCVMFDGCFIPVFETALIELVEEIDDIQKQFEDNESIRRNNFSKHSMKSIADNLEESIVKLLNG